MEEKQVKRKGCLKGCLIVFLIIVLAIGGIIGGVYFWGQYRMDKAEQTVASYLQEKYNKKFTVTNGHYIWATGTYTFDASPKVDPEFKFPVFAGLRLYENGIGDMYKLAKNSRETELLIKPYVDAISKNNFFTAACDPATKDDPEKKLLADVRRNMLTPKQMLIKYPDKIYFSTHISYAFDVTNLNKETIFKKVFNLVEFLKKKKFGYMNIVMYFYPADILGGETIKDVYGNEGNRFEDKYWRKKNIQ